MQLDTHVPFWRIVEEQLVQLEAKVEQVKHTAEHGWHLAPEGTLLNKPLGQTATHLLLRKSRVRLSDVLHEVQVVGLY